MKKINVVVGSVYGAAEQLAEELASRIKQRGLEARQIVPANLDEALAVRPEALLVITSTTGQGDIPDNLLPFFQELKERFPLLEGLPVGIICLGDSSYGDTYCGAGRQFEAMFEELGASFNEPMLRIDACETFEPLDEAVPWLERWLTAIGA